jgi:HNH endonuclease
MKKITQKCLRKMMDYNPATGIFTWRANKSHPQRKGTFGTITKAGKQIYLKGILYGENYLLHRLAWLYVFGEWPSGWLDHVNQCSTDNRIANLRLSTRFQNGQNRGKNKNNTSGFKGVFFDKRSQRWLAKIGANGHYKELGLFKSKKQAAVAYQTAARALHGEFCGV